MKKRISVAMAVYNGEKYLREQLDSILIQLDGSKDEIIISYNKSTDSTWDILMEYSKQNSCITVIECIKKGVQSNFDCALHHVNGRYIFLCDQDDVWLEGKIEKCMSCFTETKADLIMHDGYITDSELNYSESKTIFSERRVGRGLIKNSVHCSYHGCCMAMTDNLCEQVLPLPEGPFFHDMWIGEVAELLNKKIIFLDDKCILYRRHGENCSGTEGRTFYKKVRERLYLAMRLFQKYMWSKVR